MQGQEFIEAFFDGITTNQISPSINLPWTLLNQIDTECIMQDLPDTAPRRGTSCHTGRT